MPVAMRHPVARGAQTTHSRGHWSCVRASRKAPQERQRPGASLWSGARARERKRDGIAAEGSCSTGQVDLRDRRTGDLVTRRGRAQLVLSVTVDVGRTARKPVVPTAADRIELSVTGVDDVAVVARGDHVIARAEVDGVVSGSRVHPVVSRAGEDEVTAVAGQYAVVSVTSVDRVRAGIARSARRRWAVGPELVLAGLRLAAAQEVAGTAAHQPVVAAAAVQRVGVGSSHQHVITRPAVEIVPSSGAGIAPQHVVPVTTAGYEPRAVHPRRVVGDRQLIVAVAEVDGEIGYFSGLTRRVVGVPVDHLTTRSGCIAAPGSRTS